MTGPKTGGRSAVQAMPLPQHRALHRKDCRGRQLREHRILSNFPILAQVDLSFMRRISTWLIYAGASTLIGVFFATQIYIGGWYSEHPLSWNQALVVALTVWYLRALFAPAIFWLARTFPLSSGKWFKNALIHAAGSLVFAVIEQILFDFAIARFQSIPRRALSTIELHVNVLTYWVLLTVAHFLGYYYRNRERELAAPRLEAELAGAKLDLLRAQLHPHFLFNTLNGISELMHEDMEQADLMLGHLSEMLRSSLEHTGKCEVTLGEELEFLRRYLEIQRMRFSEKLAFSISVPPDLLSCRVPYLILQPLVENAVLHGIARSPSSGRVDVNVFAENRVLRIEVVDSGPGLPLKTMKEGLGLRNTRLRLLHSYGVGSKVGLTNTPEGGACVTVEFPMRHDDSEELILWRAQ